MTEGLPIGESKKLPRSGITPEMHLKMIRKLTDSQLSAAVNVLQLEPDTADLFAIVVNERLEQLEKKKK